MSKHDRPFRKIEPEEPALTPTVDDPDALSLEGDAPPATEAGEITPAPTRYAAHALQQELARWEDRRVELKKTPVSDLAAGEYAEVKARIAALRTQMDAVGRG